MSGSARRRILLVAHPKRQEAHDLAAGVVQRLHDAGMEVVVLPDEAAAVDLAGSPNVTLADPDNPAEGCELVFVLGGDGTILRGAELSRGPACRCSGVNLGHVGFLAEAEREDLDATVERIVARDYNVEERMTLDVTVKHDDEQVYSSWALNEATVEKAARERMLELTVEIDGRPLSTWGCDGIVMATPTGSTAYAFSAGGPGGVARRRGAAARADQRARAVRPAARGRPPLAPRVEVLPARRATACCGATGAAPSTCRPARASRWTAPASRCGWRGCTSSPFTDRLVAKFGLPVQGWRGAARREQAASNAASAAAAGATTRTESLPRRVRTV